MAVSSDKLMTLMDLSEMLGVSMNTLYYWRQRGDGPSGYRLGKHLRFRRSDVEAWLAAQADGASVGR